jgi:hypothetical protein
VRESRLRIAFGGLHPDRIRGLFAENGARETLRRMESGDIRTTERVRQALAVPGDVRCTPKF